MWHNNNFDLPQTYDLNFHGDVLSNPYLGRLQYRRLGKTNLRVSQIGLGTAGLGGLFGHIDSSEAIETIQQAIRYGINYIETAPCYDTAEDILGIALKGIPRHTYYVATTVGRYCCAMKPDGRVDVTKTYVDISRPTVIKGFEHSLERLGLSYVDIIQIDVDIARNLKIILEETLPTLESFVKVGKAKFIGITGYDLQFMKQVVDEAEGIDTVMNYSRYNLHDLSLLDCLDHFQAHDLGIINAAPLAQGLLSTEGPQPWHCASDELKVMTRTAVELAEERDMTIEEISLGFSLRPRDERIATTLVSTPDREKLVQNLDIVTTPRTELDDKIYEGFRALYGHGNNHWEGREREEYSLVGMQ